MLKETHPILGTRHIQRAIVFYTQQLGFKLAFRDKADPPNHVGFRRDAVELHMQFQFEQERMDVGWEILSVLAPVVCVSLLGLIVLYALSRAPRRPR
jgi:catechol 2,3-dioxygenase-like lactoylglutathione lyase family enzyme